MNGKTRNVNRTFVGKPEGKKNLEDLEREGMIILKWILIKAYGLDWFGLVVTCKNVNEHYCPVKGKIFVDKLIEYQHVTKDSDLWSYVIT
jgi:hypothetical protein